MQCCLNGVQINEIPKLLADSPSVTSHTIQVTDILDAAHPLVVSLQLQQATCILQSLQDMKSPRFILLQEPPWDPSTGEFQVEKLI